VLASLAIVLTTGCLPTAAQIATPAATPQLAAPTGVAIKLGEFFVAPASMTFIAGQPYHFVVTNGGSVTHELVIEPVGAGDAPLEQNGQKAAVEDIAKGQTKDLVWTFDTP